MVMQGNGEQFLGYNFSHKRLHNIILMSVKPISGLPFPKLRINFRYQNLLTINHSYADDKKSDIRASS
jgi:hypothetical protein